MLGSGFIQLARPQNNNSKRTPPAPTKISLPVTPYLGEIPRKIHDPKQIEGEIRLVKSYIKVDEEHLKLLGLDSLGAVATEDIVPFAKFIPPLRWLDAPSHAGNDGSSLLEDRSTETLSNGASVPGHEAFFNRARELTYDNEDAYRSVNRVPPAAGGQSVKVAQLRKFWVSLEQAGGYWDASKDNVSYDAETGKPLVNPSGSAHEELQKREPSPSTLDTASNKTQTSSAVTPSHGNFDQTRHASNDKPNSQSEPLSRNICVEENPVYTGYRHSTGSDMPLSLREELIRNFMEPIMFAFGCRIASIPLGSPKARCTIGKIKFLTSHSGYVHRLPMDRNRNRLGFVEGPLMCLHCSPELGFGKGKIDMAFATNELAILLSLAQERHREGKSERSGPKRWWQEVDMKRVRAVAVGEPIFDPLLGDLDKQQKSFSDNEKNLANKRAMAWAPKPVWSRKTTYMKIGKPQDTETDAVFLISTVAHHLSILRLDIHGRMLDFLDHQHVNQAEASSHNVDSHNWWGMKLRRSKWWDLFDKQDRLEAFRALWGVTGWLMRDDGRQSSNEDTEMTDSETDSY